MKKIILLTIILCLMANLVLGAGFVLPFMKDGIMNMYKGDSEAVWVVLQNGENKTFIMEVTQTTGKEVAYLMNDSQQLMPPYTYDRKVYFNVSVSKDAEVGDEWDVGFTVRSINPNSTGMVTFATQVGGGFTVSVVENKADKFVWTAWHTTFVIFAVVILGVIGYFLNSAVKRHKKRKEDEQKSQDPIESLL